MTFSEQIVYGWFKPSKYKDMIELPRRRFVAYVIVMMLVLSIVSYVVPTASIIFGFGGFEKLFTQSLGEVVAESLGKPYDEVDTWVGEEGVCPVCHNPLLSMNGTTHVECPICGIWGDLKVDGEKVKVEWSEKEIARARNTNIGIYEHYNEIQNMIKVCVPKLVANKDTLPKMMEKYVNFEETIANM